MIAMMLASAAAFAQETPPTDWALMKSRFADMEAEVNDRNRESGWKYSMEAEYALLEISRALEALEQVEHDPTRANLDTLKQQSQRLEAAYKRFVDSVDNRPSIWRN